MWLGINAGIPEVFVEGLLTGGEGEKISCEREEHTREGGGMRMGGGVN